MFSSPDIVTGTKMTAKDPESAGIRRKQSRTEDGSKETETEFPNGVKVSITESREVVKDRRTVELGASSLIDLSGAEGQPMRESSSDSGVIVDKDGKQICRRNDDGTVTVDSGHGVYTRLSGW